MADAEDDGREDAIGDAGDPAMTAADAERDHGKRLCGAQRRREDAPCRRPAGWGTDHVGWGRCKLHGGSTASHRQAAQLQLIEAGARDLLARLGQPEPLGDPVEELLRLGAEVRAWLEVLRELLAGHQELAAWDVAGVERERAVVRLYGDAIDRAHRVLSDLARLGLDARLVRVREAQAKVIFAAIGRALDRAGLDAGAQRQALDVIAGELRPGERDNAVTSPQTGRSQAQHLTGNQGTDRQEDDQ